MRVLLVYVTKVGFGNIPINLPILYGALKEGGHEPSLFNFTDYVQLQNIKDGTHLGFFKEASAPVKPELFPDDPRVAFVKTIKDFQPNLIGFSCLSTDYKLGLEFASLAKSSMPDIPIVFGGIHSILVPSDQIRHHAVDFVCSGEGEETIVMLADYLSGKGEVHLIPNLLYKENGETKRTAKAKFISMDKIPYQNLDGFKQFHLYRPFDGQYYKMANFELSRGCPFPCSYCVNVSIKESYKGSGTYHRKKSVIRGIDEIEFLVNKYDLEFIRFWDEDFTTHKEEYIEEVMKEYKRKINLPFLIYSRAETITDRKVELLKEMGCKTFAIGIESGNEWIRQNVLNRRISNEKLIEKFNIVNKYKIRTSAYNMIGLPHEDRNAIFDTIKVNRAVQSSSNSLSFLEPYKGTKIRQICEAEKLVSADYDPIYNLEEPHFATQHLTKEELVGLFKTFTLYIRLPEYMWPIIRLAEENTLQGNEIMDSLLHLLKDYFQD